MAVQEKSGAAWAFFGSILVIFGCVTTLTRQGEAAPAENGGAIIRIHLHSSNPSDKIDTKLAKVLAKVALDSEQQVLRDESMTTGSSCDEDSATTDVTSSGTGGTEANTGPSTGRTDQPDPMALSCNEGTQTGTEKTATSSVGGMTRTGGTTADGAGGGCEDEGATRPEVDATTNSDLGQKRVAGSTRPNVDKTTEDSGYGVAMQIESFPHGGNTNGASKKKLMISAYNGDCNDQQPSSSSRPVPTAPDEGCGAPTGTPAPDTTATARTTTERATTPADDEECGEVTTAGCGEATTAGCGEATTAGCGEVETTVATEMTTGIVTSRPTDEATGCGESETAATEPTESCGGETMRIEFRQSRRRFRRSMKVNSALQQHSSFADKFRPVGSGDEAKPGEFSYQAGIGNLSDSGALDVVCSGALISRTWVLTAAHCFVYPQQYVVLGELHRKDIDGSEQVFGIRVVIKHENSHFSPSVALNDLALVLIDGIAIMTDYVHPIALPRLPDERVNPSENAVASGWGTAHPDLNNQPIHQVDTMKLKKATLPVMSIEACRHSMHTAMPDANLCTGSSDTRRRSALMRFEGGSPLQCSATAPAEPSGSGAWRISYSGATYLTRRTFLCGLVSLWNNHGGRQGPMPVVHTQVANYLPWVENVVNNFIGVSGDMPRQGSVNRVKKFEYPVTDYPFLGIVAPRLIPLGSTDVPCVAVLLRENLALTIAGCILPHAQTRSCTSASFGLDNGGNRAAQVVPVRDAVPFRPEELLHKMGRPSNTKTSREKGESVDPSTVVLVTLSWNVIYSSKAFPVNLPQRNVFIGLKATLVSLTYAGSQHSPIELDVEIVDFSRCPPHLATQNGLDWNTGLCGRFVKSANPVQTKLHYLRGSALLCHSQEGGSPFLCGILPQTVTRKPKTEIIREESSNQEGQSAMDTNELLNDPGSNTFLANNPPTGTMKSSFTKEPADDDDCRSHKQCCYQGENPCGCGGSASKQPEEGCDEIGGAYSFDPCNACATQFPLTDEHRDKREVVTRFTVEQSTTEEPESPEEFLTFKDIIGRPNSKARRASQNGSQKRDPEERATTRPRRMSTMKKRSVHKRKPTMLNEEVTTPNSQFRLNSGEGIYKSQRDLAMESFAFHKVATTTRKHERIRDSSMLYHRKNSNGWDNWSNRTDGPAFTQMMKENKVIIHSPDGKVIGEILKNESVTRIRPAHGWTTSNTDYNVHFAPGSVLKGLPVDGDGNLLSLRDDKGGRSEGLKGKDATTNHVSDDYGRDSRGQAARRGNPNSGWIVFRKIVISELPNQDAEGGMYSNKLLALLGNMNFEHHQQWNPCQDQMKQMG